MAVRLLIFALRHRRQLWIAVALLLCASILAAVFAGRYTNDLSYMFPEASTSGNMYHVMQSSRLTQSIQLELDTGIYHGALPLQAKLEELAEDIRKLPNVASVDYRFTLESPDVISSIITSLPLISDASILDSASPLYGRADEVIKILPLMPHYIQKALNINSVKAVEEYAIWGGVPRYWEIRLRHESLVEAVMEEVLNSDGLLYDEPSRLFLDEMRDLELSSSILSLVGNGCNRLSEIAARLERPATSLTTPISRLISYGYLQRELPYAELPKNSKRSLYKIADPFLNFYFHYVTPNRSLIEFRRQERLKDLLESSLSNYVANMWEHLCRQAIPLMTIEGMTFRPASRWWGTVGRNNAIELDVVSESDDGSTVLVGECKWSGRENVDQLRSSLLQRASQLPFLRGRRVLPLLFLKEKPKSGTPDGCLYPDDIIEQLT